MLTSEIAPSRSIASPRSRVHVLLDSPDLDQASQRWQIGSIEQLTREVFGPLRALREVLAEMMRVGDPRPLPVEPKNLAASLDS